MALLLFYIAYVALRIKEELSRYLRRIIDVVGHKIKKRLGRYTAQPLKVVLFLETINLLFRFAALFLQFLYFVETFLLRQHSS